MNSSQIKYLKDRLCKIKYDHQSKLSRTAFNMTPDEKRHAIDTGNYDIEVTNNGYVTVKFPEYEKVLEEASKKSQDLEDQYNLILDRIMFAEQEDVIKLLEDFRNFKV